MAAGVMLDTSFLITLADKSRAHHEAARRYWRHFLENEIPIFLSTIVASEFSIKQEIPPEILRSCVVLPFNWDDALRAAKLDWKRLRPPGVERDALKDDIKIIAQAAQADVEFAITDDGESFYKFCQTFKEAGEVQFRAIKLADGFERAFFDPNGQRDFTDDLGGEAAGEPA
jgi:predicted nucleic acid-binding protein